jgi:hypothetical protein
MIRHSVVAVTATAAKLSDVIGEDMQVYFLSIQPAAANTGVVKLGGKGITSSVFGWRLEIPVSSIPSAPWFLDDIRAPALALSDVYIIGTAADNVTVAWIPRI